MVEGKRMRLGVDHGQPGGDRTVGFVVIYANPGIPGCCFAYDLVVSNNARPVIDGVAEEVTARVALALPEPPASA